MGLFWTGLASYLMSWIRSRDWVAVMEGSLRRSIDYKGILGEGVYYNGKEWVMWDHEKRIPVMKLRTPTTTRFLVVKSPAVCLLFLKVSILSFRLLTSTSKSSTCFSETSA